MPHAHYMHTCAFWSRFQYLLPGLSIGIYLRTKTKAVYKKSMIVTILLLPIYAELSVHILIIILLFKRCTQTTETLANCARSLRRRRAICTRAARAPCIRYA